MRNPFSIAVAPDCEDFLRCIRRAGAPTRVHCIELFLDAEVQTAICDRYGLLEDVDRNDPFFAERRQIVLQSFLGYDYVRAGLYASGGLDIVGLPLEWVATADTAPLHRKQGRSFANLSRAIISNWEDLEKFPWPVPGAASQRALDWYEENLPEEMCVIGGGSYTGFFDYLLGLMGFETLSVALHESRDLLAALRDRLMGIARIALQRELRFDCVKAIWGTDDMGFRTSTLISPEDLREFALPGHKMAAEMCHAARRPYLLHCCGNVRSIMEDLIQDVQIDAKHSFEDTILEVTAAKQEFGQRIALLGGIDMDFLCRAEEAAVRKRVRNTLDKCMVGGGYCLGTGNSVANYIPVDNYLAMLDEGRRFAA